jgi:hypothetical protein
VAGDGSVVVGLMLANEVSGAMDLVARHAAYVLCWGDADDGVEAAMGTGLVNHRRSANERRTWEPRWLFGCYTFCTTAARVLLRALRSLRLVLDVRRPIK